MAVLTWHSGKTGKTPTWLFFVGNFALAVSFTRLTGSLVLTSALVCRLAVAMSTRRDIARHGWALILWVAVTLLVPVALEFANVI